MNALVFQASCVEIDGRAIVIGGQPGSGKSSLALALIDRGARLIGDDGVILTRTELNGAEAIIASPPPNIAGLIEIRGVGLIELPTAPATPLALILELGEEGERLPKSTPVTQILGVAIPCLPFDPGTIAPAERAQWALKRHGIRKD